MAQHEFDLLVGRHIQSDKSKPVKGADGKPTGRYEQAIFNAPAVVTSDIDLVAKCGNEKFRYRGPARSTTKGVSPQSAFPQGQVSTGFQVGPSGHTPDGVNDDTRRVEYVADSAEEARRMASGQPGKANIVGSTDDATDEVEEDEATLKSENLPGNLYSMTVVELKQYAEDNEIDLGEATRKDDLVKAIKKAHGK